MSELELYIKSYFGVIQNEELKEISSFFEFSQLEKGDYFLEANQKCNELCFVQSGLLRMFFFTEDKEVTQWIATKGNFSTDLSSFVFEKPSRLNIQALIDTEIYTISKENYKKIGEVVVKWHELEKLFIIKCFTILEDRIFNHLSMSSEERYNAFFENNKELFNQVPLQYIASLLGMTPETFSRIRKKQFL